MTEEEALDLLDLVRSCNYKARAHRIANGEWIVVLVKDSVFVWNVADWRTWLQEEETRARQRKRSA